ncbi:hypothetical protein KASHIRA_02230 [Serratia phage vB_SmaM-Kashira]|nr:hypothetical protein KASHIRA_02230 [Serratia phage vB_SmaM-Kashira]
MKYNQNPDLPSLESLQSRIDHLAKNLLCEGYKCYTGHLLTAGEAASLNRYVIDAKSPTVYNDQAALSGILDRRHQIFVMTAENWEYVVGLGRYAHPDEAARFKEVSQCTA